MRTELTAIVKAHCWDLASSVADATHHVVTPPAILGEDSEEYFRVIDRSESNDSVLAHWWYFPDSYDTWCTNDDHDSQSLEAPPLKARWDLNARWLYDLRLYNEIMNEEDYDEPDYQVLGCFHSSESSISTHPGNTLTSFY